MSYKGENTYFWRKSNPNVGLYCINGSGAIFLVQELVVGRLSKCCSSYGKEDNQICSLHSMLRPRERSQCYVYPMLVLMHLHHTLASGQEGHRASACFSSLGITATLSYRPCRRHIPLSKISYFPHEMSEVHLANTYN